MNPPSLQNRRVLVMGLGRFGGGVGVTRFLARRGARVTVTDRASAHDLASSLDRIRGLDVSLRLGGHHEEDFRDTELVVVNPAVNPERDPYVAVALAAGVPLTSEVRLLVAGLPDRARVVGVTGSAGKSTTSTLIHAALQAAPLPGQAPRPRAWLGGNIGGSLLDHVEEIRPGEPVVLELSSFMLHGLREDRWSPGVAVMTSFSDNHLDWHGSLDHYRACKQAILDHQGPNDCAVLGPGLRRSFTPRAGRVIEVRGAADAHDLPPLALPGDHNRVNAALAVAAAESLGVPRNEAAAACAACRGLPHRLQWLCEWAGVRFYNDSKATTPQAASLALDSFPQGVVHLIMGGADKGSDLRPLAAHAAGHARAVYTLGALGEMLADLVRPHGGAQVHACGTLRRAVETALTQVRAGDVVLLSPGCSSLDQFPNYEERGRAFAEAVLQCTSEGAVPPRVG